MPAPMPFAHAPLITPERLRFEPLNSVFAITPRWVRLVAIEYDDPDAPASDNAICFVAIGKKHTKVIQVRPDELAVLMELSRFGGGVVTNSNHNKPVPQIYAKFSFPCASGDLMNIRRIVFGASEGEATKALAVLDDYRAESTYSEPHHHPEKDAREVALKHAETMARQAIAAGKAQPILKRWQIREGYIAAYLGVIRQHLANIDKRLAPAPEAAPPTENLLANDSGLSRLLGVDPREEV